MGTLSKLRGVRNVAIQRVTAAENELRKAKNVLASAQEHLDAAERQAKRRQFAERAASDFYANTPRENLIQYYVCKRKVVYIFEADARRANWDEELETYSCVFCSGWHNGHRSANPMEPRKSNIIKAMVNELMKEKK